ncbi:F-box family protein, partial [Trifolium medium]|nr:F-box family protein [Trifolium medium]
WLRVIMMMPPNLFILFAWLNDEAKNKKVRKGFRLVVLHTMLWVMWKSRNNHIFNNVLKNPIEIDLEMECGEVEDHPVPFLRMDLGSR